MKTNIMIAVAVLAAVFAYVYATPAESQGLWSAIKGSSLEPHNPSAKYRVETPGYDVRFYEFVSKANPEVTCVMGFSESGPVGLQCFDNK